jgi:hypothetical protein
MAGYARQEADGLQRLRGQTVEFGGSRGPGQTHPARGMDTLLVPY